MTTVTAIYENGAFRPTEPVDLPEGTCVRIQAIPENPAEAGQGGQGDGKAVDERIYAVLSESQSSGHVDTAARHDEHAA